MQRNPWSSVQNLKHVVEKSGGHAADAHGFEPEGISEYTHSRMRWWRVESVNKVRECKKKTHSGGCTQNNFEVGGRRDSQLLKPFKFEAVLHARQGEREDEIGMTTG